MFIKAGRVLTVEEMVALDSETGPEPVTKPISLEKQNKEDKWYVPKLNINDPLMWPSQPMENRRHFTDKMAEETCLGNCCGVPGVKGACCHLDPDDLEHVLGPLDEEWIKGIIKWLQKQGITARRADIVIDYEEGKIIGEKFFNGHKVFESPGSYPMMRFQIVGPRFACKFLNADSAKCTIYSKRPDMCRNYLCSYVKANFLVRTKGHPNTYQKIG